MSDKAPPRVLFGVPWTEGRISPRVHWHVNLKLSRSVLAALVRVCPP